MDRRTVRGVIYCILWYCSIVAGFFSIACPLLPILVLSPPTFRKCGDLLFSCWELYPTVLLEMCGVKIIISGDHILPNDSSILVMNHRTRVDWNFLWAAMYQACMPNIAAHKLKMILKDPIRHVPGPGWIMQMNGFLYITRRWEADQKRLANSLDYLVALHRRTQILIFPEGTDLTANSKVKSDKYAVEHNLPKYEYTLHPKTTGFSYLIRHLQEASYLDAVYDITIAYPDYVPQCEVDLVRGNFPTEVHFHFKRIPKCDVPKDEVELRNWLEKRWSAKEELLEQFSRTKSFSKDVWPRSKRIPLIVGFVFWTGLIGTFIFLLCTSLMFQLWTLFNIALFVGMSFLSPGFNQIEMAWYWKWKSLFWPVQS